MASSFWHGTGFHDACRWWAFLATQHSPGAMAYYRRRRAAGDRHEAALRRLANKPARPAAPLPDRAGALRRRKSLDTARSGGRARRLNAPARADTCACRMIVANSGSPAGRSRLRLAQSPRQPAGARRLDPHTRRGVSRRGFIPAGTEDYHEPPVAVTGSRHRWPGLPAGTKVTR